MSKIICDVCGTSFPETATQCPICGCVRSVDAKVVAGSTNEAENQATSTYTHVKGGRFSKSNVKKRNSGKPVTPVETETPVSMSAKENGKKDTGIIITTIALLLAIVAVVVYIAVRFFAPSITVDKKPDNNVKVEQTTNDTTETNESTEGTVAEIPCTEIVLSKTIVEFDEVGESLLLNVTLTPADTTDSMIYATSDESIASVNSDGKITAVGGGEALITVICGNVVTECQVICNIEEPTEETEPSASASDITLNR